MKQLKEKVNRADNNILSYKNLIRNRQGAKQFEKFRHDTSNDSSDDEDIKHKSSNN